MTLLRAMDPAYSTDEAILKAFYPTETVKLTPANRARIEGALAVGDVIDPESGEVYLESGEPLTKEVVDKIYATGMKEVMGLSRVKEPLTLTRINEDPTATNEEALLKIYQRLRPGNPPQLEKAKELFREKFQDANRYRLGKVGRFRINRKFNQDIPESEM